MCLLAIIAEEPSYGYEMAKKLKRRGLALVGEGSIYPLLSRLQRGGLVQSFTMASSDGPPRKYYRLAAAGQRQLNTWSAEWRALSHGVNQVLDGGRGD